MDCSNPTDNDQLNRNDHGASQEANNHRQKLNAEVQSTTIEHVLVVTVLVNTERRRPSRHWDGTTGIVITKEGGKRTERQTVDCKLLSQDVQIVKGLCGAQTLNGVNTSDTRMRFRSINTQ